MGFVLTWVVTLVRIRMDFWTFGQKSTTNFGLRMPSLLLFASISRLEQVHEHHNLLLFLKYNFRIPGFKTTTLHRCERTASVTITMARLLLLLSAFAFLFTIANAQFNGFFEQMFSGGGQQQRQAPQNVPSDSGRYQESYANGTSPPLLLTRATISQNITVENSMLTLADK